MKLLHRCTSCGKEDIPNINGIDAMGILVLIGIIVLMVFE